MYISKCGYTYFLFIHIIYSNTIELITICSILLVKSWNHWFYWFFWHFTYISMIAENSVRNPWKPWFIGIFSKSAIFLQKPTFSDNMNQHFYMMKCQKPLKNKDFWHFFLLFVEHYRTHTDIPVDIIKLKLHF